MVFSNITVLRIGLRKMLKREYLIYFIVPNLCLTPCLHFSLIDRKIASAASEQLRISAVSSSLRAQAIYCRLAPLTTRSTVMISGIQESLGVLWLDTEKLSAM